MVLKLRVKNRKRENNQLVIDSLQKCLDKWDKELYKIRSWSNKEGVDTFFSKEVSKEDVKDVRSCVVGSLNINNIPSTNVIIGEEEPSYLRYRYRYDRLEKKKEKKKQTTLGEYMQNDTNTI